MTTMTHEAASLALVVELPDVAERDALIGHLLSEAELGESSIDRICAEAAIEFGVRSEICRGIIEGE
jgi:hypothetical protein